MAVNNSSICDKVSVLYQNRHCNQKDLSTYACRKSTNYYYFFDKLFEFKGLKSENYKEISFLEPIKEFKLAVIDPEVFLVGGCDLSHRGYLRHIQIYSKKTKKWRISAEWPTSLFGFCVTSFRRKLFVIGGSDFGNPGYTNACLRYEIQENKWSYVASMNLKRFAAACTVFEGKIVVSGGICDYKRLKSVEAYDHHENKWSCYSDMFKKRFDHSLVSMGNKMLVVSDNLSQTCEILDSVSRKFTSIKPLTFYKNGRFHKYPEQDAYCVGNSVAVFSTLENSFVVYDLEKCV